MHASMYVLGLSLVSMSVNLIQMKLEKTYHGGVFRHERPTTVHFAEELAGTETTRPVSSPTFRATLGILQSSNTDYSSTGETQPASKQTTSRASQTILSFPVARRASIVTREGGGGNASVRLLKPKQRSLTNLLQPSRELQQHEVIRHALANVGDAATVIIFVGDRERANAADYVLANDIRSANVPLGLARTYSNVRAVEGAVMEVDANRNESLTTLSDIM